MSAFTRNWLTARGSKILPPNFGRLDGLALGLDLVALVAWVAQPAAPGTGWLLLASGIVQSARLSRWRGLDTGERVREVPRGELAAAAGRRWPALGPEEREGTAIMAPTRAIRREVNDAIREGLEAGRALHGRTLRIDRLVDRRLTRAQAADIRSWEEGDTVVFHRDAYGCLITTVVDGQVVLPPPCEGSRDEVRAWLTGRDAVGGCAARCGVCLPGCTRQDHRRRTCRHPPVLPGHGTGDAAGEAVSKRRQILRKRGKPGANTRNNFEYPRHSPSPGPDGISPPSGLRRGRCR